MTPCALVLTLAFFAADDVPTRTPGTKDTKEKPKRSPYAPSLPYLTKEQEDKLDEIVERYIQYDIGRLQGKEGAKALKERLTQNGRDEPEPAPVDVEIAADAPPVYHWTGVPRATREEPTGEDEVPTSNASPFSRLGLSFR